MNDFDARWRQYWEGRYKRPLTEDELREIQRNLAGYFGVLAKIDKRLKNQGMDSSSGHGIAGFR